MDYLIELQNYKHFAGFEGIFRKTGCCARSNTFSRLIAVPTTIGIADFIK
jgi:hypothetical protein